MKNNRKLITAILFSLLFIGNIFAQESKPAKTENSVVEFTFTDFNGKPRKFSEFKGKYVLLDFWATWCKPCLADFPKLKEIYDKHKANGFEIIGMDAETIGDEESDPDPEFAKETTERAKALITNRLINWTQATSETSVPVARKLFNVSSLPAKILIDPNGNIIGKIKETKELDEMLTKLLSEKKQ